MMTTAEQTSVDFYFDVVCPYAYLASTRVREVAEASRLTLRWVPILLGGLFREIGAGEGPMATMPASKKILNRLDIERWAEHLEVPLRVPDAHPRRTVLAMRSIVASGDVPRAAGALFRRYWRDGLDIENADVVRDALDAEGLDGASILVAANEAEAKATLRTNTDAAVAVGLFGVPSFIVHHPSRKPALIWGQDRMHFIGPAASGELLVEVPS
jgi:2-hydroxychromene-2-carboxylate isomerase